MFVINYHKTKLILPSCWNELTKKKLLAIMNVIHSSFSMDAKKLIALRILSNKNPLSFSFISNDLKARSLFYTEWIFKENTLTTQHLTSYSLFFQKKLFAPANDFDNLTLGEFHYCEMMYHKLVHDKSESAMNELIAVLYREKKKGYNRSKNSDGDIRIPFNNNEITYRAAKIAKWPASVKQSIMYWYDGCRQNLSIAYPTIFEGGEKQPSKHYFDGLFSLIRNLAGNKYGLIEQVEKLNIHTAMLEMVYSKQEAEQLKSNSK